MAHAEAKQVGYDVAVNALPRLSHCQTAPLFRLADALSVSGLPINADTMLSAADGWHEVVDSIPEAF